MDPESVPTQEIAENPNTKLMCKKVSDKFERDAHKLGITCFLTSLIQHEMQR